MTHQQLTAFENIVGKGEIACTKQFLLLPECFLLNQIIVSQFVHFFDIISLFAAEFEKPKIDISGKGLNKWKIANNNCLRKNVEKMKMDVFLYMYSLFFQKKSYKTIKYRDGGHNILKKEI